MSRTRRKERANEAEVEEMPALLTIKDVAYITGWSRVFISKECREGMFKDFAVKCGGSWTFNKIKLLQALGMSKEADERSNTMSNNDRTYQHEDVMQAIVSALLFGEKAGLAAIAEYDEEPDEKVMEIHPEGGSVLHVTAAAAGMLAEAQAYVFDAREEGHLDSMPNRVNHYLLADPQLDDEDRASLSELFGILSDAFGKRGEPEGEDEAAEIDMSEVTPGNTEKVYRDQPIPEREA